MSRNIIFVLMYNRYKLLDLNIRVKIAVEVHRVVRRRGSYIFQLAHR
jgi:hypothetical protein